MSKKIVVSAIAGVIVIAAVAYFVTWAWKFRDTPESRREARKETSKALRASQPEAVLPFLERLVAEKSFHTWFTANAQGESSPWRFWTLRFGKLTRVPYDYIGQLTEDQFIRFAGDNAAKPADVQRLKEMLAFSDRLIKSQLLTPPASASLRERRLDGFFLTGDYDGAISYMENEGLPNRSPAWCKGTAAKLRAHKAMEKKDNKEAVKQLLVFGEFMLSDEQKDFEDCDPTTGIVYSRDWVVARNFMRCSKMSRELKDAAAADKYLAKAKEYFAIALTKAKDDEKSLETLKAEIKADALDIQPAPLPSDKPAAEKPVPEKPVPEKPAADKAADAK